LVLVLFPYQRKTTALLPQQASSSLAVNAYECPSYLDLNMERADSFSFFAGAYRLLLAIFIGMESTELHSIW
jgi:hypothetical protein